MLLLFWSHSVIFFRKLCIFNWNGIIGALLPLVFITFGNFSDMYLLVCILRLPKKCTQVHKVNTGMFWNFIKKVPLVSNVGIMLRPSSSTIWHCTAFFGLRSHLCFFFCKDLLILLSCKHDMRESVSGAKQAAMYKQAWIFFFGGCVLADWLQYKLCQGTSVSITLYLYIV